MQSCKTLERRQSKQRGWWSVPYPRRESGCLLRAVKAAAFRQSSPPFTFPFNPQFREPTVAVRVSNHSNQEAEEGDSVVQVSFCYIASQTGPVLTQPEIKQQEEALGQRLIWKIKSSLPRSRTVIPQEETRTRCSYPSLSAPIGLPALSIL